MTAPRIFTDKPAVRAHVPLLIGLMGPSGGGKSYSALRLATGIQRVAGGEIYALDTESRRLLHYADQFSFRHVEFEAPYGSLDYLAGIRHCVAKGASVVIIDSMSHEHTGEGGYLSSWEAELDRMAGDDYGKRERMKFAGLIKPAERRRKMLDGILHLPANFIFCFRAKEKLKPVKEGGRLKMQEMGFMPIAGEELVFEMTVNCLLLPKANGVPTWRSDEIGERLMMKLPGQFTAHFSSDLPRPGMLPEGRALDEDTGQALAEWARGNGLIETATARALAGTKAYEHFWLELTNEERKQLTGHHARLKAIASNSDAVPPPSASDTGGRGDEVPLSSVSAPSFSEETKP